MSFSIKQLFQTSFHLYRVYWKQFLLFSLILVIPITVLNIVDAIFGINKFTLLLQTVALLDMIYQAPIVMVLILLSMILTMPVIVFVYRWYNQQPLSTVRSAYQATRGLWWSGVTTGIAQVLARSVFILIAGTLLSVIFSLFVSESTLRAQFGNIMTLLSGLATLGLVFVYQSLVVKQKKHVSAVIDSVGSLRRHGGKAFVAVLITFAVVTGIGMALTFFAEQTVLLVSGWLADSLTGLNYVNAFVSLPFRFLDIVIGVWGTTVFTLLYAFFADPPVVLESNA